MLNVYSHLESLWALERVNASTLLSIEEKKIIVHDLLSALPDPLIVASAHSTLDIVKSKLMSSPSIKTDEEPIDRSNNRPSPEATELPRRHDTNKEERNSKTKTYVPLQEPNVVVHTRGSRKI